MVGSSGHSVKLLSQSVHVSLELVKLGISPYGVNVHGFLGGWSVSAKLKGPVRASFVHSEVYCLFEVCKFLSDNLPREVVTFNAFLEDLNQSSLGVCAVYVIKSVDSSSPQSFRKILNVFPFSLAHTPTLLLCIGQVSGVRKTFPEFGSEGLPLSLRVFFHVAGNKGSRQTPESQGGQNAHLFTVDGDGELIHVR